MLDLIGLTVVSRQDAQTDRENYVICDQPFSQGVHYWEIICPVSVEHIQFGVTASTKQAGFSVLQTFKSTTKRTVGVMLDIKYGKLSFWLNGRLHKIRKDLSLGKVGLTWYPCLRLPRANLHVTLNPYCNMP